MAERTAPVEPDPGAWASTGRDAPPSVAALQRPSDERDECPNTTHSHRRDQEHDHAQEPPEGAEDHPESDGRQREGHGERGPMVQVGVSGTTCVPAQPDQGSREQQEGQFEGEPTDRIPRSI